MSNTNKTLSKTSQIAEILATEIRSGKFKPGDKLPSMRILSTRFNVSTKVLYDAAGRLEADGLIQRGARSGIYIPDDHIQSKLCGVITSTQPGMKDNYFEALMAESTAAGYSTMISNLNTNSIKAMIHKKPLRLFVDVPGTTIPYKTFINLTSNVETVFFHSFEWEDEVPESAVLTDWVGATEATLRYFLERGHRKIAFLSHGPQILEFKRRQMIEAGKRVGLKFETPEFQCCCRFDFENNPQRINNIFRKDPPTAIFCRSDYLFFEFIPKLEVYFPKTREIEKIGMYDTIWSKQPGREFSSWSWDWYAFWRQALNHNGHGIEYYHPVLKNIMEGKK